MGKDSSPAAQEVRGMLLPLQSARLLLPNAVVLEVVSYKALQPIEDAPEWLLGYQSWRERLVPVVAFEVLLERSTLKLAKRPRLAICKTLGGNRECPFIAILLSSMPMLVQLSEDVLVPLKKREELGALVQRQVTVGGHRAWIPDLNALEWRLQEVIS